MNSIYEYDVTGKIGGEIEKKLQKINYYTIIVPSKFLRGKT